MSMSRSVRVLLLGTSAVAAAASREQSSAHFKLDLDFEEEQTPKRLFADTNSPICGGNAIRKFISEPESLTDVRNIPWSQVEVVADEFLRNQAVQISSLRAQIEQLKIDIPLREQKEALKPLDINAITAIINETVTLPETYRTFEVVQASQCGMVFTTVRPRPASGAFTTALAAFEGRVTTALETGNTVIFAKTVSSACSALLGDTGCGELCQQFAAKAVQLSDEKAGAIAIGGKASDQLRMELEEKTVLLKSAVMQLEQCQQLKADVAVFRSQLQGLEEDSKDKHLKLLDARGALQDAQYDLADAKAALDSQGSVADQVDALFTTSSSQAEAAKAKFDVVSNRIDAVSATINASAGDFERAQADLKAATGAVQVLLGLKGAVSDSMLKMILVFDEAVREPIRAVGLSEKVDIEKLFPQNTLQLASAKSLRKSLDGLSGFCQLPSTRQALATKAFKDVDASQLCAVGNPEALSQDIDDKLGERVDSIKDCLHNVQSWLCPFRGQVNMSSEVAAGLVKEGEPAGLREVITAFGRTDFYQKYLQNWKLKGKFIQLYAGLQAAEQQAALTHQDATRKLAELAEELRKAQQASVDAQKALQDAVAAKAVAQNKQQDAQTLLTTMRANAKKLDANLQALEDAVAEAERRWRAAQLTLQAAHREGVSLIQLFDEIESALPM